MYWTRRDEWNVKAHLVTAKINNSSYSINEAQILQSD